MKFSTSDINQKLQFFSELLSYDSICYLWTYSNNGTLLTTNCPDLVLDSLFRHSQLHDYMMNHTQTSFAPLMMNNEYGLVWGAAFEQDEKGLARIHLLGPFFTGSTNHSQIERALREKLPPLKKAEYMRILNTIPVVSFLTLTHRILMMQYCLTGEHIHTSDIVMQHLPSANKMKNDKKIGDRIQIYMAEQSLLQMIRTGDINYHSAIPKITGVFTGHDQFVGDPLQNAKLGQIQFIALCCHAAIEGGVSTETAYTHKDSYVSDINNARSLTDVNQIGQSMFKDYVHLVYEQRISHRYSKVIRSTCEYIDGHLQEKITAELLADRVGYSNYYLSRIFKKETGFSIDEYTRNARIEKAKILLVSSFDDIADIAESLGFNSRDYFASTFKKVTGLPPAAYRKKFQKL